MKRIIFFCLGFVFLLSSCRDTEVITPPDVPVDTGILENYEPTVTPITGSVDGFITDENGDAIEGATVKLGNASTTTNEDGHFDFLNIGMNKAGTIIQVTHTGYFDGSRRFIPTGTGVDRVRVQLLQLVFDQSVNGAAGGDVIIPGANGTVAFPSNSIVDANGDTYTGMVDVAVKYLDPTAAITNEQMPGDLFGVTEELEERMLSTFGMIAVELVDANGNSLNMGQSTPATITMPVPASILGRAPATIPLWSYNEDFGVWVEEGEATLINGEYVGQVAHFSWWNCDIPAEYATLTLDLVDQTGSPLSNFIVFLTSTTYGTTQGMTNSLGEVSGIIPAGEQLLLEVKISGCSTVLHSQNIGPFTNPSNTISVSASLPSSLTTTIAGSAACNGSPITNFMMKIDDGTRTEYIYDLSTNFSVNRVNCAPGAALTITLIDLTSVEESLPISGTSGTTINLGTVDACQNTLSEFITLTLLGTTHTLVQVYDSLGLNGTGIYGYQSGQNNEYINLSISFAGTTVGSFPGTQNTVDIYMYQNNQSYNGSGNMTNFDVTTFNSTEIKGSFSGTLTSSSGSTDPITGSFDSDL